MPIAIPNLDDRSADDLFAELRARIPVHTPEWTNLGDADPGVTMLQLFSWLADNLLYRSNRIPEASRRKFLTLLGVGLRPASPAHGIVTFGTEGSATTVLEGTVVRAGKVPFRTRHTAVVLPIEGRVFYKKAHADLDDETLEHLRRLHEPFLGGGSSELEFYDPVELDPPTTGVPLPTISLVNPSEGAIDRCVWVALACSKTAVKAAGGDAEAAVTAARTVLAGSTLSLGVHPASTPGGRVIPPKRVIAPTSTSDLVVEALGSAPLTFQQLDTPYAENVLELPGVIDVQLPQLDSFVTPWDLDPTDEGTGEYPPLVQDRELAARIVTWLRLRYAAHHAPGETVSETGAALSWVDINAARIVQSVRTVDEPLGVGTGASDQQVRFANTPVLVDDPEADPVLEVYEDDRWQEWTRTDDLSAAQADDRVFELDPESGVCTFGDGLYGKRVAPHAAMRATYEHGGGPPGMVPIDAIKAVDGQEDVKVRNPLATWGAEDIETVAAGERRIPRWLRHRDRLVTASDFRDIALRTPGVDLGRVDVLPLFDPRPNAGAGDGTIAPGVVTVMVLPRADGLADSPPDAVDAHVVNAVCNWLDTRRLITTEVYVRGPRWVRIWVSIGITPLPGAVREVVERDVRAAVRAFLSPLSGGLHARADNVAIEDSGASPDGWPLGSSVRVGDIVAAATRVPGVRNVEGVKLASRRAGGTVVNNPSEVSVSGVELPTATVFVTTGEPADPSSLLGVAPAGDGSQQPARVPVPVIPKKC